MQNTYKPILDSLTNILDGGAYGGAYPNSVFGVNMTSTEAVTDVLRDGLMDSCLEPKPLAQNSIRLLFPSSPKLHRIRVFSRGFLSCSPVYGITLYGVTDCSGEYVACELQMCASRAPQEHDDGIICSFTCLRDAYRYALLDIQNDAISKNICEVDIS